VTTSELLLIAGMTLVTFLPRWGVLALLGRVEMPAPLFNTLKYVPVAVLAAIITPELLLREGQLYLSWENATLMAGIAAGLIAWRTRNLLLTIGVGLLVFFLWQMVIAPLVAAAQDSTPVPTPSATDDIQLLRPEVLNTYPHDTGAFTQGLLLHDGVFYESTGLVGLSTLRKVEIETGAVLQSIDVPPPVFAEGLALVDDRLIQITWQSGEAYAYDLESFEKLETFSYQGEGWGLCYDGDILWMSDGSSTLTQRDPLTFEALGTVNVLVWDQPVTRLNELECVDEVIYANIWMTDFIVRIDKATGIVTGLVDGSELLTLEERQGLDSGAVLNGIAYNAEDDTFYLTGKLWPSLFEVRLEVVDSLQPPQ
jgi:glutaminyl-peptide cyclotransferase